MPDLGFGRISVQGNLPDIRPNPKEDAYNDELVNKLVTWNYNIQSCAIKKGWCLKDTQPTILSLSITSFLCRL